MWQATHILKLRSCRHSCDARKRIQPRWAARSGETLTDTHQAAAILNTNCMCTHYMCVCIYEKSDWIERGQNSQTMPGSDVPERTKRFEMKHQFYLSNAHEIKWFPRHLTECLHSASIWNRLEEVSQATTRRVTCKCVAVKVLTL